MAKKIILTLFLILFGILCLWLFFRDKNSQDFVEINNHKFSVEIADTAEKRSRGLGGRENLCSDCGMLFVFPEAGDYSFWMKDMKFPLDIIWIDGNQVVYITKNITPDYIGTISPGAPADKVLEINAGLSDKYRIQEGDLLIFK